MGTERGCDGLRTETVLEVIQVLDNGERTLERRLLMRGEWVQGIAEQYGVSLWGSMDGVWLQRLEGTRYGITDVISGWTCEMRRTKLCCSNSHFHVMWSCDVEGLNTIFANLLVKLGWSGGLPLGR